MKKELSPATFWAVLAGVAAVVVGAIWYFATPNVGERAPAGAPPPTPTASKSASPPPPPPSGFPRG